ncbi:MAG: hypothetical protein AB7O59_13895 [Pirellulales bacterium]
MQSLLLLNFDDRPFDADVIELVFRSSGKFQDIRLNEPGGALVEADYVENGDRTTAALSASRKSIWLSGTSNAALRAALILQSHFAQSLRMVDTEYSFDFRLSEFATVEELIAAIENAPAD